MKTLINGLGQICKDTNNKLTFLSPIGSRISFNVEEMTIIIISLLSSSPGNCLTFTKNNDSLCVLVDLLTTMPMSTGEGKIHQLVDIILSQVSEKESTIIKEYLKVFPGFSHNITEQQKSKVIS